MDNLMRNLDALNKGGTLEEIDLAFGRFLQKVCPDIQDGVLKAAILTSYAFRQGNVCISLREYAGKPLFEDSQIMAAPLEEWIAGLKNSTVVGEPGSYRPLILDHANRLYFHKHWHYEQQLAQSIHERVRQESVPLDHDKLKEGLQRLFVDSVTNEVDWQQIATVAALRNSLTVISGGPGTGKTTTVVKILALMLEQAAVKGEKPSIALAAPTGKAAARLEESVSGTLDALDTSATVKEAIPREAQTLHQLLGARRNSSTYRYNEDNPLPYDVVVVDEASMIDQMLMNALMQALLHDTKLIFLGDKDQLASVEAGSVLGSICAFDQNKLSSKFVQVLKDLSVDASLLPVEEKPYPLRDHVLLLEKNYRFDKSSGIPELAESINKGKSSEAWSLLESESYGNIRFTSLDSKASLDTLIKRTVDDFYEPLCRSKDPEQLFRTIKRFMIFSPHRKGPFGIEDLNRRVQDELENRGLITKYQTWYHGKPIIINRNDYTLGLNNGEIGICHKDKEGAYRIVFQHGKEFRDVAPSRLPEHEEAYALTVHKSQGSEFEEILLFLPNQSSRVLTRELLYTAITRARSAVQIAGTQPIFKEGIQSRLRRTTGLKELLWENEQRG